MNRRRMMALLLASAVSAGCSGGEPEVVRGSSGGKRSLKGREEAELKSRKKATKGSS